MNRHHTFLKAGMFVCILLLAAAGSASAQSARARGMGGAFLGVSDDETATYYNPAGLSQIEGREASLQSKVDDRDIYHWDSLAFTGHIYEDNPKDTFSVTDYLEHNVLEEPIPRRPKYSYGCAYTEDYRSRGFGKLVGGEFAGVKRQVKDLQLAFGTRFPIARRMLAREQLYGGIKLRFASLDRWIYALGTHANRDTQSLGIGLMYHYNDRISGGLTVDNLVQRVDGDEGSERDGVTLNLGGALRLTKGVLISADTTNITNSGRSSQQQYRIGVEKKFIENDFTLRMGTWNGTLTLGFGMHILPNVRFDYAYYNGEIVKEHHVGAHLTFD
ncbi:MAG: hypothetical protein GX442_22435 [Candidatus Riflebacteria bacterium]|nr:hypothetical protein [Candidatus Riflebacteria bacterium]